MLSLIVSRIATVALTLTGLSRGTARSTRLRPGDILVYGRDGRIGELDCRGSDWRCEALHAEAASEDRASLDAEQDERPSA